MKTRLSIAVVLSLATVVLLIVVTQAQGPKPQTVGETLGTSFTYQGQLKNNGAPVDGNCDMAFRLYDAASDGTQVGTALTQTVPISDGLFIAQLDFGAGAFNGDARWLDIHVRCPAGSGTFAGLSPRQALTAAPYALHATAPWATSGNDIYYAAGNVGIGTTSPSSALSVDGDITLVTPVEATIGFPIVNAHGKDLVIQAGGNLSSHDSAAAGGNLILKAGNANISGPGLPDQPPYDNNVRIYAGDNVFAWVEGESHNGNIEFFAGDGLPERMRIVGNSGNVGIGTTAPQSRFQVVGNYIQFPTRTGAPPSGSCDDASEYGRVVVRTDGTTNLYVCTSSGWIGK